MASNSFSELANANTSWSCVDVMLVWIFSSVVGNMNDVLALVIKLWELRSNDSSNETTIM